MPAPASATLCAPTASDAVRGPVAPGMKVTRTAQLAPAASVASQVVVSVKSDAFVPETAIAPSVAVDDPPFVTVTVEGALAVPTLCAPKSAVAGLTVTAAGVSSTAPRDAVTWTSSNHTVPAAGWFQSSSLLYAFAAPRSPSTEL